MDVSTKMRPKLFCALLSVWTVNVYSQTHFTKFKSANYKAAEVQYGSNFKDSLKFDVIDLSRIQGLRDWEIHLREITDDSSKIMVYKNKKLIQTFHLPFMFWYLESECLVADFDNNKKPDLKLTIQGGGAGLAGELAYKIYLFNQGTHFKLLSFIDFSHEKEYDLNKDGVYEIIGCNHVYKDGHSYWVYNAFNFSGSQLKNISRTLNYPLWTKHLYRSREVIATNISKKDRYKEFRALPDETIIK